MADIFVVVNKDNPVSELNSDQVERLFLLKSKRFENGDAAEPVNQSENSKARLAFNTRVLDRNEQQLKYYWSRKMFSGSDKPPPAVGNDQDVENYIAEHAGGIGYMLAAPKNVHVKVVLKVKE